MCFKLFWKSSIWNWHNKQLICHSGYIRLRWSKNHTTCLPISRALHWCTQKFLTLSHTLYIYSSHAHHQLSEINFQRHHYKNNRVLRVHPSAVLPKGRKQRMWLLHQQVRKQVKTSSWWRYLTWAVPRTSFRVPDRARACDRGRIVRAISTIWSKVRLPLCLTVKTRLSPNMKQAMDSSTPTKC